MIFIAVIFLYICGLHWCAYSYTWKKIYNKNKLLHSFFFNITKFLSLYVNLRSWPLVFSILSCSWILINNFGEKKFFCAIESKYIYLNTGIYVKKTTLYFCAQSQTRSSFETTQTVWVPKYLSQNKWFF